MKSYEEMCKIYKRFIKKAMENWYEDNIDNTS